METPFCGWLLCCGGALLGSLIPTFALRHSSKLVIVWLFSCVSIVCGTFICGEVVLITVDIISISIFHDPDFVHKYDPSGFWLMLVSIAIPTMIVTATAKLLEKPLDNLLSADHERLSCSAKRSISGPEKRDSSGATRPQNDIS